MILPVNVPAIRYSRDEIAVVSGATGSWVSLLPDDLEMPAVRGVQDSGRARRDGALGRKRVGDIHRHRGIRGRRRVGRARGAVPTGIAMQTAPSMAKRFNMVDLAPLGGSESKGIQRICRVGASNGRVSKR